MATASHCRPSSLLPIPQLTQPWAAYQFDAAVLTFGLLLENARQETTKAGDQLRPKYTMKQLLTPGFRLPLPAGMKPDPALNGADAAMYEVDLERNRAAVQHMMHAGGMFKVLKGKPA